MNGIILLTFVYFAAYIVPVFIAKKYDETRQTSTGVFATTLAIIMTLIYIISSVSLIAETANIDASATSAFIIVFNTLGTVGYIAFRKYQDAKCPTLITTETGEVKVLR